MREFAALARKRRELREKPAIGADQIEAGEHDGDQGGGEKQINLALDAGRRFALTCRAACSSRSLFSTSRRETAVLRACLAGLQGEANLFARFVCPCRLREGEHAIHGVPELREGRG